MAWCQLALVDPGRTPRTAHAVHVSAGLVRLRVARWGAGACGRRSVWVAAGCAGRRFVAIHYMGLVAGGVPCNECNESASAAQDIVQNGLAPGRFVTRPGATNRNATAGRPRAPPGDT